MDELRPSTFAIDGNLLESWQDAEKKFSNSLTPERRSELTFHSKSNPETWLKNFRNQRHGDNRFQAACASVGNHMSIIQGFVQAAGFSVTVISTALPVASPASLVMNAFAWLFESFVKISEDFDRIEAFFQQITTRFESLSIIKDHLSNHHRDAATYELRRCVVDLFGCCLRICSLAFEQVKGRLKKWVQQLKGKDSLSAEMKAFVDTQQKLRDCLSMGTYSGVRNLEARMEESAESSRWAEKEKILEWLSPLNYSQKHRELQDRISENGRAGSWLLRSDHFKRWRDGELNQLWYIGKPGAGKSVLASIIFDHLEQWKAPNGKSSLTACLYLTIQTKPDLSELLGSVLRQFQVRCETHPSVKSNWDDARLRNRTNGRTGRPRLTEIKAMITQISMNKQVFVIVDGLDECPYGDRQPLLSCLKEITNSMKILITSRDLNHREELQKGFLPGRIEAHDEDMDEYIESIIDRSPSLKQLAGCHDRIKSKVKSRSGKMFLIVRLHMDSLSGIDTVADLNDALERLPDTIPATYASTLVRIRQRPETKVHHTMSTLAWVAYAQRPLSIHELRHALAMHTRQKVGPDVLRPGVEIISDCCGLLFQDSEGMVRYVHYTADDFFSHAKEPEFENFDKHIALASARYLSLMSAPGPDDAWNTIGTESVGLEDPGAFPFACYAGKYLHSHHRKVQEHKKDDEFSRAMKALVKNDNSRALYSHLLFNLDSYDRSSTVLNGQRQIRRRTLGELKSLLPIHVAVFLGNLDVVEDLIHDKVHDLNSLDPYGQSALILAVKSGLDAVASTLLEHGAKVDLYTKKGHIILLYAVERDYHTMTAQIVRRFAHYEVSDGGLQLLWLLMMIAWESLVVPCISLLSSISERVVPQLDHQVASKEPEGMTTIVPDGEAEAKLRLDDCLQTYGRILYLAYQGDKESLLQVLDYLPNSSSLLGRVRPQDTDAEDDEGHSDIENFEWSGGRHGNLRHDDHRLESSSATNWSRSSTLSMEASGSWEHDTHGNTDNIAELVETSNRFQDIDSIERSFLRTACFLAVERGRRDVLELLLARGITPNLKNFQGQSLLHRATARNDEELVKLLLDQKAEVDQRDQNGRTPLLANADMKKLRVLELLMRHGADINLEHNEGCHELYEAAVYGAADVVEFFLKKGVPASVTNNFGWTPLHGAAANGHEDCVRLLIDHLDEAKCSPISDTGKTPLDFVLEGLPHYDSILSGAEHYKSHVLRQKEWTKEEKLRRAEEIEDMLDSKKALTSDELYEQLGYDGFNYGPGGKYRHPSWGGSRADRETAGKAETTSETEGARGRRPRWQRSWDI